MDLLHRLLTTEPLLALFITIALGYLVGKLKVGNFVLGGIAGTLLVGVVIGQFGVDINSGIKSIFFALFIYAVGFQGGPQFFHALNRRSLNQLVSAFVMCFAGLLCVLAAAWMFDLDRGMAQGLLLVAQSAIIGTRRCDAIRLTPELTKMMQTNVAVGCRLLHLRLLGDHHGELVPALVMKWDVRAEAIKLANQLSGGHPELDPGQFNAARQIATRIYEIAADSKAAGKTALTIDQELSDASVEAIYREGKTVELTDATVVQTGDRVAITGMISILESAPAFGRE